MSTIENSLAEFKEIFSFFEDPMDKFAQLIDMSKNAEGLSPEERNESNQIFGCASQAWVVCASANDNQITIRTDSDAHIVRGLLHILEKVLSGQKANDIYSIEANDILENIGLNRNITSQRTNGFISAISKIKKEIRLLS